MDLALPTEEAGPFALCDPQRSVHWLRRLYEKAIGGFYRLHLDGAQWLVHTGKACGGRSPRPQRHRPGVPRHDAHRHRARPPRCTPAPGDRHQVHPHLRARLVSRAVAENGYEYQLYAYLRSQEGQGDPWADAASGLLLHPAIDGQVDEAVQIQGHQLRFATVDLAGSHAEIKATLLSLAAPCQE